MGQQAMWHLPADIKQSNRKSIVSEKVCARYGKNRHT